MKSIEKHILEIEKQDDFSQALKIFEKAILDFGYSNYFFSNMCTQSAPSLFTVKFFKTNYPDNWVKTYLDNKYSFHDPIALAVMANHAPFYWSKLIASAPELLTDKSMDVMQHASKHGIVDGMGMSYFYNQGNLYTLTLSKNSAIKDYDNSSLAHMYLLGAKLVEVFEKKNKELSKTIHLTTQEQKIVTLGAVGKTDGEIAQIMEISVNTIRYHWKNIFEKFDCYSRVLAIIQAMNRGFVRPGILEITTESGSSETYKKAI